MAFNEKGEWVIGNNELQSEDYKNFVNLSPEQQQAAGQAGVVFDKDGKLGLAAHNYTPKAANDTSMWGSVKNLFTPQGAAGTSTGGNMLSGIGSAIGGISGLAGMYYTGKNYKLAKEAADLGKAKEVATMARQAKVDAAGEQLRANVGNGASYNYMNTVRG